MDNKLENDVETRLGGLRILGYCVCVCLDVEPLETPLTMTVVDEGPLFRFHVVWVCSM